MYELHTKFVPEGQESGLESNPHAVDTQKWLTKSTAGETSASPTPFDTELDKNTSEDSDNLISLCRHHYC